MERTGDNCDAFSLDWPTCREIRLKDDRNSKEWKRCTRRGGSVRRAGEAWNENVLECLRRSYRELWKHEQLQSGQGRNWRVEGAPSRSANHSAAREIVASARKRNFEWACLFPASRRKLYSTQRDWLKKSKLKRVYSDVFSTWKFLFPP